MRTIELTKIEAPDRFNDNEEGEGQYSVPVMVNVDSIRCFYPRKQGRPGTRITFSDGGGFAVQEAYDDVKGKVRLQVV